MGVVQAAKLRILIAACRVLAQRRAALGKYLLLQFQSAWLAFGLLQCTSQQGAGHPPGLALPQRCPGRLPGFLLQLEQGSLQIRRVSVSKLTACDFPLTPNVQLLFYILNF